MTRDARVELIEEELAADRAAARRRANEDAYHDLEKRLVGLPRTEADTAAAIRAAAPRPVDRRHGILEEDMPTPDEL